MLNFVVVGIPQPQGSTRAFTPKGWTRPIVTSDNPKNKGWRQLVAEGASHAIQATPAFRLLETSAVLRVVFFLPRPKAIRNRLAILHTKKPDLDKLTRSCCDALSGVVWRDDSLVVEIAARKYYTVPGEPPRAEITITEGPSQP